MRILVKEKLGPHRYKTPEGYLVCIDAILARTGKQAYTRDDLYHDGSMSTVILDRKPDQVFAPETLASFENKPLCNEHPEGDVTLDNYKDLACGYVRDVRKGIAGMNPVMLGNIVVTDKQTIDEIESGTKNDLSCGYDCDIIDDGNGNLQETNIRGNHVALCEEGRAGIAHIQDSKETIMFHAKNEDSTFQNNGTLKDFKIEDLIEKVKSRHEALNTVRTNGDDEEYTIVLSGHGYADNPDSVDLDITKASRQQGTDADDFKNYQMTEDRIFSKTFKSYDEAAKAFNAWKNTVRLHDSVSINDSVKDVEAILTKHGIDFTEGLTTNGMQKLTYSFSKMPVVSDLIAYGELADFWKHGKLQVSGHENDPVLYVKDSVLHDMALSQDEDIEEEMSSVLGSAWKKDIKDLIDANSYAGARDIVETLMRQKHSDSAYKEDIIDYVKRYFNIRDSVRTTKKTLIDCLSEAWHKQLKQ